jgi:hypothetical protein
MSFRDESQRYDRLIFWDKAERLMIGRSPFFLKCDYCGVVFFPVLPVAPEAPAVPV